MAPFDAMPILGRFFLAFVVMLTLIGTVAWAVRRFGTGSLRSRSRRVRRPRLAILEHTQLDGRRRLCLVRRDNIEHLLLLGGPSDIVVESNVARSASTQRETAITRAESPIEALPHTITPPGNVASASWPLQPDGEPAPRGQRDTLSALADER